ncbi:MAG: hypothetical protein EXS46_02130 [Candidatus Taylorbacteria bacterium]|nr:hypothetical protein [Candidatus Taylorbacteria bacterium]
MNEHERRMFMLMQRFHRSAYDCANEAVSIKLEHLQIHSRATMSGEAVHENHSCDIYNMKIKLILDNQSAHEERKRCLSKILAYTLAFEYGITGNFTLAFFYGGEFVATATDDQLDIPPKGPSLIQLLCMLEKIQ